MQAAQTVLDAADAALVQGVRMSEDFSRVCTALELLAHPHMLKAFEGDDELTELILRHWAVDAGRNVPRLQCPYSICLL